MHEVNSQKISRAHCLSGGFILRKLGVLLVSYQIRKTRSQSSVSDCDFERRKTFAVEAGALARLPDIQRSFLSVSCEHYGSAGKSDSTGVLRRQGRLRVPAHFLLAAPKAAMRCIAAVCRRQNACDRTTGSLRSPYSKKKRHPFGWRFFLEQGTGVEPASAAWEAAVLPMYEPCLFDALLS